MQGPVDPVVSARPSRHRQLRTKVFTALIDSGSSESYIHSSVCSKLSLTLVARSPNGIDFSEGEFVTDIVIKGSKCAMTRLNVLPTLCCDILGLDFQSQHQLVIFELGGNLQDMIVSQDKDKTCAVAVAETQEVCFLI